MRNELSDDRLRELREEALQDKAEAVMHWHPKGGRFLHVSVPMQRNPFYGVPQYAGLPQAAWPFMPAAPGQTCRSTRQRLGKAETKRRKRMRTVARRIRAGLFASVGTVERVL